MSGVDIRDDIMQAPPRPQRPSITAGSESSPTRPPPRSTSPASLSLSQSFSSTLPRSSSNQLNQALYHQNQHSPPTTTISRARSNLLVRPESISLEQRLSNFDHIQTFDLELGGPGEKQVKVSRKAQALLGLGVDLSPTKSGGSRGSRLSNNDGRDEEKQILRDIEGLIGTGRSPARKRISNQDPSTPPPESSSKYSNSSSLSPIRPMTAPTTPPPLPPLSGNRSSFNSPKSPSPSTSSSYRPNVSRSGSTFSSLSASSPSPSSNSFFSNLVEKPISKEKRGSTFMGFSGLKNLGRKKSTASSVTGSMHSTAMSRSRGSSHSSFGDTGALDELEEGEDEDDEGQYSSNEIEDVGIVGVSGDIRYADYSDGDMEELEDEDEKEDDYLAEDYNGALRVQVRSSKAAALLGLGDRVGSPESTGMTRNGSKVTSSIGSVSGVLNGGEDLDESLPPFPCQKMDLEPHQIIGNQLSRQTSHHSSFLRQKEWKSRFIILSSYIAPTHTTILAASLHSFKANGSVDKEIDRLDLTPGSLVYLPEDQHGKLNVLRITGLAPRESDESDQIKKGVARREEVWLIALENVEMLKIWMAEIKGAVHELGGVNTATPIPSSVGRSGSFSSNMSGGGGARRESEPRDNLDGRSSTSMSMSSLTRYPGANSPIGFNDSSTNAYYRPNTVTSAPISLPLPLPLPPRISTSPINVPVRPPRPPRSPRSPSDNNMFRTSSPSKSSGQTLDDEDNEFDESTIHPYRRPSIASTNNITTKRLVLPVVGPNFARRGSADSGLQSPASNHSGKSNNSSISTSSLLYRSPAPMGPLPDTPPPSELSRNASTKTMETKDASRTSFISTSSNGSSKSRTPKASPPPMPAPTESLPPPPTSNGVPLLPLVLPRLVREASPNTSSKFVVPPRREFSTSPLPPPTSLLPLPPPMSASQFTSFPMSAPTSPLPAPPPAANSFSVISSLPPPTAALPPTPTSPPPEFPRPPPRSSDRRPTTKLASNIPTTP